LIEVERGQRKNAAGGGWFIHDGFGQGGVAVQSCSLRWHLLRERKGIFRHPEKITNVALVFLNEFAGFLVSMGRVIPDRKVPLKSDILLLSHGSS